MVNQLAMETRKVMKGSHSRKTAAFVRVSLSPTPHRGEEVCLQLSPALLLSSTQACAAYSFITIPSLSNIFSRLNLYLLSGQVALSNQCLSQGERNLLRSFWIDLFHFCHLPWIFSYTSFFDFLFYFSNSRCFPKSSSQCSTRGSSLHQRGGEVSPFRELPAGLYQQLPGHASRCPGDTIYFIYLQTKISAFLLLRSPNSSGCCVSVFAGSPRARCALPGPGFAQHGPGLHLGR